MELLLLLVLPRILLLLVAILSIAPMWILPPNTWAVAPKFCFFFCFLTEVTAETRARNWHTQSHSKKLKDKGLGSGYREPGTG